jgi:hypothetical protein
LGPNFFIAQTTVKALLQQIMPNIVNSHPLPMAWMRGWAIIPPTQLNIFLTKLFTATPLLLRFERNSVSLN